MRRYEGGAEVSAAGDCVRKVGAGTLCGSCTNLHQTLLTLVNTLRVSTVLIEYCDYHPVTKSPEIGCCDYSGARL